MSAIAPARAVRALLPLAALALGACATATSGSSYAMQKAPYYHGRLPAPDAKIAVLPVGTPPVHSFGGGTQAPPPALRALLDSLDGRLGVMVAGPRLAPTVLYEGMPRARFGCAPELSGETARMGKSLFSPGCADVDEKTDSRENQLDVRSGTRDWRARVAAALAEQGADYALLVQVVVSDQWVVQRGFSMSKEVRLGTGYTVGVPWLSSLETPVTVVQLAAVLVDAQGKVVRSGVEGMLALQGGGAMSLLGVQKAVAEKDLDRLRVGARRDDLPGRPLVWAAALDALVRQVTGRVAGTAE